MSEPREVLRAAVAHGLPGAATPEGEVPRLSAEVVALAAEHRVQGLLWSALEAGAVAGDDAMVVAARESLTAALHTCLLSEETAVLALESLTAAGVDARALKGVAIAHLDHDDPAERVFGDADLLVPRVDYRRALAALTTSGFRRAEPPVRGWWEQRFGKSIVLHAPSGGELDLHLAITGGYFGARIDHDRLWSTTSAPFGLAGGAAHGLDREGRLLNACCHAVLGGGSGLRARRDVAQLVLLCGADWQAAVSRAEHDGVDLVLAEAARVAWAELQLDHVHGFAQWAAKSTPDPVQQRALTCYTAALTEGWAPEGRSTLAALGPLDRVRFLAGLALPSQASMRFRRRTRWQHLRGGVAKSRNTSVLDPDTCVRLRSEDDDPALSAGGTD